MFVRLLPFDSSQRLRALVHGVEQLTIHEEAIASLARDLADDSRLRESLEDLRHRIGYEPGGLARPGDRRNGVSEQLLVHERRAARDSAERLYLGQVSPCDAVGLLRGCGALVRGLANGPGEEPQPGLPVALGAHRLQHVVVLLAMVLEVQAQEEDRVLEDPIGAEHKGDEEPADAPIAIEKGMDGLELHVGEGCPDQ